MNLLCPSMQNTIHFKSKDSLWVLTIFQLHVGVFGYNLTCFKLGICYGGLCPVVVVFTKGSSAAYGNALCYANYGKYIRQRYTSVSLNAFKWVWGATAFLLAFVWIGHFVVCSILLSYMFSHLTGRRFHRRSSEHTWSSNAACTPNVASLNHPCMNHVGGRPARCFLSLDYQPHLVHDRKLMLPGTCGLRRDTGL